MYRRLRHEGGREELIEIVVTDKTLERIEQKIDRLIEAIGFRLPYAQKGEEDYGRQKESDRSRIEGGSPGKT